MHTCTHCQKDFFSNQSLKRHKMNICLTTCKEIHQHINHLMSINTSNEMIIESLKAKFTLKDINFMDIQHRFTILKHEYARKKIIVSYHLDHAFHNNDFHDGHKEVVKHIFESIYNNDISSKEFSEKIKVEYDFAKFYVSFLDLVKSDHGEPTPRAYKIADDFVSDRINNSVIEESKMSKSSSQRKRSREDETYIRSFHHVSTSSSSSTPVHPISVPTVLSVPMSVTIASSTLVHPISVPTVLSVPISVPTVLSVPVHESTEVTIPDSTELHRGDSTDDSFDFWSSVVKFVDKYTKHE